MLTPCSKFCDSYISKGEKGGEAAADAIWDALQNYFRDVPGVSSGMDVIVRAFANVRGLGKALERDGRLNGVEQLRAFTTGFSNRRALFDFVDVGYEKERADNKIRGSPPVLFSSTLFSWSLPPLLLPVSYFLCPFAKPSELIQSILSSQRTSSFSWTLLSANIS